jgi:glucose/arabinose dehydrogenase
MAILLTGCLFFARFLEAGVPVFDGYTDTVVATNIPSPTHIAFAPDGSGRLFITLKNGAIGVLPAAGGPMTVFATIRPIFSKVECGVLGLCFSPDFVEDRFVYVFVSVSASEQRILRYRDVNGVGADGIVLVAGLPTRGVNHDGGSLAVGPDARLYWGIGDNGSKRGVDRDLSLLCAKVSRANLDGSTPLDNPFLDATPPRNAFVWATGFRNPFTMTFQPRTGRMWLGVVGSSAFGDTVPHSTVGFEQIFSPAAGEDGGWDDYEGNQPAGSRFAATPPRPLAHPVIQYPTDYAGDGSQLRSISAISRLKGQLTATLQTAHPFRAGEIVKISGTEGFDGFYLVGAVQGTSGFTTLSAGPDLMGDSNTGTVQALKNNGCVIGGCFYESTAFPAAARGGYFFADYNSGVIWHVPMDANGVPLGVTPFVTGAGKLSSMDISRNGSLYYADIGGNAIHAVVFHGATELLVAPTTFHMLEGGTGVFSVRLPGQPAGDVTVNIAATGGTGASAVSDSALTFTASNWNVPQTVKVAAPVDAATSDKAAAFTVSAEGYPDETVTVHVTDISTDAPILSAPRLSLGARGTGTIRVALPSRPRKSIILTARRSGGTGAQVTMGGAMVFTPDDWNVPRTVQVAAKTPRGSEAAAEVTIAGRGYFSRRLVVTMSAPR